MKLHTKTMLLLTFAAVFLLTGCAAAAVPAAPAPAPAPAPVSTEPAVSVVADAGEYDVKIYTIDPNAPVEIIEESVPLASAAELDYVPGTPMTKRQAEALAIQMAGLTQDEVKYLFAKEDWDDGIRVFEVSFRSGDYEYELEVTVETGEVLSFDKESIWD